MELKAAMEAATADLDVRPGFVGDVMAGARRRHTRKLLTVTAVLALLAGVTTGVVLTRSPSVQPVAEDVRLTAATSGDLAGDTKFVEQSLAVWNRTPAGEQVTQVSPDAHVFWAANTPAGPASLVVQSVLARGVPEPQTMVGLVHGGVVIDRDVVAQGGSERGIYRLGDDDATYVVLGLGQRIFWSANPVRGPDLRYSRTWQAAELRDGVAVVKAKPAEKPVFVRMSSPPAADDFTRFHERISPSQEIGQQKAAMEPYPVLGWSTVIWATPTQVAPASAFRSVSDDLRKRGYLDYSPQFAPTREWEVRASLPDGRYAAATEVDGELIGVLYRADGTFDRVLLGGPLVRGKRVPVRLVLPDGQGTILADRGALIGPEEREGAWLAPAGTTEVTIWRTGNPEVIPL